MCHSCKDAKYMIAIDRLTYFRFQGHGFFLRASFDCLPGGGGGGTVWGVVPFFEKNSALLQFPPRRDMFKNVVFFASLLAEIGQPFISKEIVQVASIPLRKRILEYSAIRNEKSRLCGIPGSD